MPVLAGIRSVCLVVSMLPIAAAHAGETLDRIAQKGKVVLAHREASIPFSYLVDGRPVGYSMDICLRLVEAIKTATRRPDLQVEFLPVTSATRIATIVDGKADLECGSTTNNADRRRQVAFTIAHFIAGARMLVRADSGIRNWPDLRGKAIVTTKGTTNARSIAERNDVRGLNIRLVEAEDHSRSFAMVEGGAADAFAMDDVLLFGLRAAAARPKDFAIVGDLLSVEPYAIMFSRADSGLKTVVDREMARIIDSGEMHKLYEKWFIQPIPPGHARLGMRMSGLLRESFRYPSDKVAD
jgi:ABC-type amino acid transport substrate-binding protein